MKGPFKIAATVLLSLVASGCVTSLHGNALQRFNSYENTRGYHPFKAFAFDSGSGSSGRAWGWSTPQAAMENALNWCRKYSAGGCRPYAVGNTVVAGMSPEELETVYADYVASVREAWQTSPPDGVRLTGEEIESALAGSRMQGEGFYAFEFELVFERDGTMTETRRPTDDMESISAPWASGSWWIDGDRYCDRYDFQVPSPVQCYEVVREGETLHFINTYGDAIARLVRT